MNGASRTSVVAMLVAAELVIVGVGIYSLGFGYHPAFTMSTEGSSAFVPRQVQAVDAGLTPRVTIDDANSGIHVSVSNDGLVHVTDKTSFNGSWFGMNGAGYPQLQVTHDASGVRITRANYDNDWFSGMSIQRVDVQVPSGAQLAITNAGLVDITGLNGGTISAHCDDGHIEVRNLTTPSLALSSDDGHIDATNLTLTGASPWLKIATGDGHITASGLFPAGGTYDIASNDGSVRLALDRGSNVTVNASTDDGDLRVNDSHNDTDNPSDTLRIGNGAAAMRVHSDDGSVAIITNGAN